MRVEITALANGGEGVTKTAEGKTLFVPASTIGDVLEVEVTEDKKKYARASICEIIEAGPSRVEPFCPYAGECGGCDWQHINYETQLKAKYQNVFDSMIHIGLFDENRAKEAMRDTVASPITKNYRNKVEFECGYDTQKRLIVGLHKRGSNEILPVDACPLLPEAYVGAPKALQGALRFLSGKKDLGVDRVTIRVSTRTKAVEVALWTKPGSFPRAQAAEVIGSALPGITSITRVIYKGDIKERKVSKVEVLSGNGYWKERMLGETYKVSSPSFFQVNTQAAEILGTNVLELLGAQADERIFDLFCGVGTFTLPLARQAEIVRGVESYGSSFRDLQRNAQEADLTNITTIGGDAAIEFEKIKDPARIIVDPPFCGCEELLLDEMLASTATRIVYVSCNPTTLARDLGQLRFRDSNRLFHTELIMPVDLFPQTSHVETIVLMSRKRG